MTSYLSLPDSQTVNLSNPLLATCTIPFQLLQQFFRRTLPVPLRVILGPSPQIVTCIFQRSLCLPAQFFIGSFRISRQIQHVSCSPTHNLIRQLSTHRMAKSLDDIEDRAPLSRPQVPRSDARMVIAQVIECDEVALREVENVYVVADGGAVVGGIVYGQLCKQAFPVGVVDVRDGGPTVAEYEQFLALPDRHLGEQGEQVVRDALRVFAHDAAGVRARGVEIPEEGGVPVLGGFPGLLEVGALGFDVVGDAGFDGGFGAAVGVGGADGAGFGDGDHVFEAGGVAVDGGGGGEDDVGDVVAGHGGEEADGAVDVGAVVF